MNDRILSPLDRWLAEPADPLTATIVGGVMVFVGVLAAFLVG